MVPLALGRCCTAMCWNTCPASTCWVGFAVLTVAQFAISLGPDYPVFFVLRTIEDDAAGHFFTALMTYSSAAGGQHSTPQHHHLYRRHDCWRLPAGGCSAAC